jgi:hypothetical protein
MASGRAYLSPPGRHSFPPMQLQQIQQVSNVSTVLGYCNFQFQCSATEHYSALGAFVRSKVFQSGSVVIREFFVNWL